MRKRKAHGDGLINIKRIFNKKSSGKDVTKIFIKYIKKYRAYLFTAAAFMLIIAPIEILVPFVFKKVIDRVIIKSGYIVSAGGFFDEIALNVKSVKLIKKSSVFFNRDMFFLPSSLMKYLSKSQRKSAIETGVISKNEYILVENPVLNDELRSKVDRYIIKGKIKHFSVNGRSYYLIKKDGLKNFTVEEIVNLRSFDIHRLFNYVVLLFSLLVIEFFIVYFQVLFLARFSQYTLRDLRIDLFNHILKLNISFFDKTPVGKLVSRVTNDIDTLNEFFSSVIVTMIQDFLVMFGIAVVMFVVDFKLSMIVLSVTPLVILAMFIFRKKARKIYSLIRNKISNMNSFLNESISGIKTIKIFAGESSIYNSFKDKNHDLYNTQLKQLYIIAVFRPIMSFFRWIAIALLIYYGTVGIIGGSVSYGIIVMFVAYIEKFFSPLREISEKFDVMQSAVASAEKIASILNIKNFEEIEKFRSRDGINDNFLMSSSGFGVNFKSVFFYYREGEWVLNGLNLVIYQGEVVAVVGRTGVGKTTMIELLQRFYTPVGGEIEINGVDINNIPLSLLRKIIVSVPQEPFLFSGTIKDNVTMGNGYVDGKFWECVEAVGLKDIILSYPERENTLVMERGANLSFGEKQLLAFARALYADPGILVLDEATSSIDSETERKIQNALVRMFQNRTSIVIAHRPSTVKYADRVIVLDDGKVVEEGTHEELMKKNGLYKNLYYVNLAG